MPPLPAYPDGLTPIEWVAVALVAVLVALLWRTTTIAQTNKLQAISKLEGCIDRIEASRELETSDRSTLIQALRDKAQSDAEMASECHAGQARSAEAIHAFDNAMRSMERVSADLSQISSNLQTQCLAHREMDRRSYDEKESP
jgi:hypothetical protein